MRAQSAARAGDDMEMMIIDDDDDRRSRYERARGARIAADGYMFLFSPAFHFFFFFLRHTFCCRLRPGARSRHARARVCQPACPCLVIICLFARSLFLFLFLSSCPCPSHVIAREAQRARALEDKVDGVRVPKARALPAMDQDPGR